MISFERDSDEGPGISAFANRKSPYRTFPVLSGIQSYHGSRRLPARSRIWRFCRSIGGMILDDGEDNSINGIASHTALIGWCQFGISPTHCDLIIHLQGLVLEVCHGERFGHTDQRRFPYPQPASAIGHLRCVGSGRLGSERTIHSGSATLSRR